MGSFSGILSAAVTRKHLTVVSVPPTVNSGVPEVVQEAVHTPVILPPEYSATMTRQGSHSCSAYTVTVLPERSALKSAVSLTVRV